MRSRLLLVVLVLVGLLAVGLGVPLALTDSQRTQEEVFTDRLTDTISFASAAQRALIESPQGRSATTAFAAEITRYDEVYGVAVLAFDRSGELLAASRPSERLPELAGEPTERLTVALAGRRSASTAYPLLMPWDTAPIVLAEPVLVDGEVVGAAMTVSPTGALRAAQVRTWSVIAGAAVLALLAGTLVALPLTAWVLRPVRRLDEAMDRIGTAVLAGGPPEQPTRRTGPPELRSLAGSFDRMSTTVREAIAGQRAFVADASHQLRNPLTALRLRLSNLDGAVAPGAADDHLAAMEEAERLSRVLDGLLALARAERAAETGDPDAVTELDAVVDDRVENWRPLAEHTGVELLRGGPLGLRARIDPAGLETVLDAVLDNALKYTPSGGRVRVETLRAAGRVGVSVVDAGPGMPAEDRARATDRFWRAPGQVNLEGSGLGLAIAARTAAAAGGVLVLDPAHGGGLRVAIWLDPPARRPPGGAGAAAQ
ncbi:MULTISPECIES: sensor histidine kinase [Pseudonocardia]|uniref:histidine kinase n=2 Tax=Pseudonocardia TaxID=1847 RepID=A0A1Y2MNW7_PSEAH|nr:MULTISPECIES: HAMP domain-containing sensor histidine kinase [Pseudonocardia]OSY36831.1 Signal transduction histidine-protein kinase ArlS [Pseudonocardia autotrophica]TDN76822.1 signal transduction histidine kinase [Pseudonocardia autotrophica]BBG00823.1 two-component sensor histidine kinase [Pseudonocardia autotrophica]GEC28167.1 two-component sensor histidine kinase [Pseudonocardia saturnea]